MRCAMRLRRNQRALEEPLRVDHAIIGLRADRPSKHGHFRPGRPVRQLPAPAPYPDRDYAADRRVHLRDSRKWFLDHPIDRGLREPEPRVADRRAMMDHVTKRRCFDKQDSHDVKKQEENAPQAPDHA